MLQRYQKCDVHVMGTKQLELLYLKIYMFIVDYTCRQQFICIGARREERIRMSKQKPDRAMPDNFVLLSLRPTNVQKDFASPTADVLDW